MSDYVILQRVVLLPRHMPTGKTRHFAENLELPPPHELKIVQLPPDQGYYLLYFDDKGRELTDTYHDSLDKAIAQAKWEFGIEINEWEMP